MYATTFSAVDEEEDFSNLLSAVSRTLGDDEEELQYGFI
jgi:hypothetical protein